MISPAYHDETYLEAIERLRALYVEAHQRELPGADAAALATGDPDTGPSIRTISVAVIDDEGVLFFADSASGKGRQLAADPRAGLCFFWPQLNHQVVVEGAAGWADAETADRCWNRRPRERRLAAWAAHIGDDADDPLAAARERFAWDSVPRPPGWDAIRLTPQRIELWKVGWREPCPREQYAADPDGRWRLQRLAPL